MSICSDWHIHTHCSCDSACLEFETLVKETKELGITDFGVSDHYHTRIQEADIANSRREYDGIMEKYPELKGHFHFGIEATVISAWEVDRIARGDYAEPPVYGIRRGGPAGTPVILDLDDEFMAKYKIDYVVTGMHWPMYCEGDLQSLLKEYHRQYLFAATHPYTTIMAHYLWWDRSHFLHDRGVKDAVNPFLQFDAVPQSMRDELKAALKEHGTAFEINFGGILFDRSLPDTFKDEYLGWAAELQRSGVVLAIGSDCHSAHLKECEYIDYAGADKILKHYGMDTDAFFNLSRHLS